MNLLKQSLKRCLKLRFLFVQTRVTQIDGLSPLLKEAMLENSSGRLGNFTTTPISTKVKHSYLFATLFVEIHNTGVTLVVQLEAVSFNFVKIVRKKSSSHHANNITAVL